MREGTFACVLRRVAFDSQNKFIVESEAEFFLDALHGFFNGPLGNTQINVSVLSQRRRRTNAMGLRATLKVLYF